MTVHSVISVLPKSVRRSYRKHNYAITYIPEKKSWLWVVNMTIKMSSFAKTIEQATKEVEKHIDLSLDGPG